MVTKVYLITPDSPARMPAQCPYSLHFSQVTGTYSHMQNAIKRHILTRGGQESEITIRDMGGRRGKWGRQESGIATARTPTSHPSAQVSSVTKTQVLIMLKPSFQQTRLPKPSSNFSSVLPCSTGKSLQLWTQITPTRNT